MPTTDNVPWLAVNHRVLMCVVDTWVMRSPIAKPLIGYRVVYLRDHLWVVVAGSGSLADSGSPPAKP